MAQFSVEGRCYTASREMFKPTIPRLSDSQLDIHLDNLRELEIWLDIGIVKCSAPDWDEICSIAVDITNEIGVRSLLRSCGIYLEVR